MFEFVFTGVVWYAIMKIAQQNLKKPLVVIIDRGGSLGKALLTKVQIVQI